MDPSEADLLDTFKAAALSVTKLYKTSAAAASKARADGYQECLEDLFSFLDKKKLSSSDAATIRQWAAERQDGRELPPPTDSDDDVAPPSSPATARAEPANDEMKTEPPAPPAPIAVPTKESFSFQPTIPLPTMPQEPSYPNLANLDLSEPQQQRPSQGTFVKTRIRPDRSRGRSSHVRSVAGQKRKINFEELFDVESLAKDGFPFGKRSRHS